jgi:hypothetical protein
MSKLSQKELSLRCEIETNLASLSAFLCVGADESFCDHNEEIQQSFMLGCFRMSKSIGDDFQELFKLQHGKVKAEAA